MGDPVLRLAVRATRRTSTTAWGIAFAIMVLVGSLSLIDGLRDGIDSVASRLTSGLHVYIGGDELLESRIDPDRLVGMPFGFLALRVRVGQLEANGLTFDAVVASLSEYTPGLPDGTTTYPLGSDDVAVDVGLRAQVEAASGRPLDATGNLTLLGLRVTGLPLVTPPPARPPFLSNAWAWVRPELLAAMNLTEGGLIQAVVMMAPMDPGARASLGLERLDAVGAIGFVRGSVDEASSALSTLAFVIAAVVGLLVYHGMSLEVHLRGREIRILRGLGAGPRAVAAVYAGQAFAVATFGAAMGSALGVLAAHAIVSFAPLAGLPNLVILVPPVGPVALAFGVALGAAGIGALVPAVRAARVARRAREVGPSC
jgi:hypothetical protein